MEKANSHLYVRLRQINKSCQNSKEHFQNSKIYIISEICTFLVKISLTKNLKRVDFSLTKYSFLFLNFC